MMLGNINAVLVGDDTPITGSIDLRTVRVHSLNEAHRQLRKYPFDMILTNLKSSKADQVDVIRELHREHGSIPIVALSNNDDTEFALEAVRCGAQDVILSSRIRPRVLRQVIWSSIERKRLEQHRLHHCRKDELTGLANGLLLEERFERAMARADRQATLVALVAVELDQPKLLCDMHGHDCLDRLMPLIGERLLAEIRETDTLARTRDVGFTWLVEGLAAISDISILVNRVPGLLADPFCLDDREVRLTASAGVAVCPFHGQHFATLLKMAEAAMLDVSILNGDGLLMPPLPSTADMARPLALA